MTRIADGTLGRSRRVVLAVCVLGLAAGARGQMKTGEQMRGYAETLGVVLNQRSYPYSAALIASSIPGNILWPGEQPTFTFQLVNNTDQPVKTAGKVDVIAYGTKGIPGDIWAPDMYKIADVQSLPIEVDLKPKGYANVKVSPKLPERFGAYALVVDLGKLGRQFVTSCVRTFQADPRRLQYPSMSLDHLPHDVLRRLGIQAIRMGWSYTPTDEKDYDKRTAELDEQLQDLQANQITVLFMIGTGHRAQPLGRGRPHLDANGLMLGGKEDLAWLPARDDDFEKWVATVAGKYGWPKGPITAFSLWNEPWEGLSISGWGADMIRYRELFTRMARGVEAARKDAGVQVLIGGCDSSSNTFDKLFGDGSDAMLKWLDVCTIHYQGLEAPSTWPQWVGRKGPYGRVKIWDTESWTANTDDRVAAVIATNRACGYDRAMGVYGGNVASDRREQALVFGEDGKRTRVPVVHAWSVAASIGAAQHFIGERPFREILFRKGLPWVMVFDGQAGSDDGTIVVVGDIGEVFGATHVLFRTARGLKELAGKEALRAKLAALPADANQRADLEAELDKFEVLSGATMTVDAAGGKFSLFDFYGNAVAARDGRIVIPLNHQGFFLRSDGSAGSFAALVEAVRKARVDGYEPLETIACDMTAPIAGKPVLELRLTNILNRPVSGTLAVKLGKLRVEAPAQLSFRPHETQTVAVKVVGGEAQPSNTYPLELVFDAGADGRAVHYEPMHCNVIARRTIEVDGRLDDWKGVPAQPVAGDAQAGPSLTEAAWFPFTKFDKSVGQGFATGYLACDEKYFYFAAKIADETPHEGTVRFEKRDDDAYFYPQVSYEMNRDECLLMEETTWDVAVRKPHALQTPDGKARSTAAWTSPAGSFAVDLKLPPDRLTRVAMYFLDWDSHEDGRRNQEVAVIDPATGKVLDKRRFGRFGFGTYGVYELSGEVRVRFQTRSWLGPALSGIFFDKAEGKPARPGPSAKFLRLDEKTEGNWRGVYGAEGYHVFGTPAKLPAYVKLDVPRKVERKEYRWPDGVRRFSYRTWPALPAGNFRPKFDNVQIAFNAIPIGQDGRLACPPGTMPRFTGYKCTDYEYALNPVAARYGGGVEIWRMLVPGMPRKHFYPRQPASPFDGPVRNGKLAIVHEGNTRIVEVALPWSEIPDVKKRLDADGRVKFSFRVNDDQSNACMELARGRSVSQRNSHAIHVDWAEHWANEVEFGLEK